MVAHVKSLILSILMILPILAESTVVAAQTAGSGSVAVAVNDANVVAAKPDVSAEDDANRYLNAVREFADNVLKYGRDTYGPKHTPLFVDGLMVRDPNNPDYGKDGVFKPVEWIAPNGDRWILSNLASQQNLFRTLDALTTITGDPKYKQAAMDAIRYAFDNLRSPNGLLYWGGHAAYDLGADKPCGRGIHELKANYPYYELMWEVDSQATKEFIEAFWSAHILDWSNLDFDRHMYNMNRPLNKTWEHEYKGGPVFFDGRGVTFSVTGSDLCYAAASLTKLSADPKPIIWGKRLEHRYVETRNANTGISSRLYTKFRGDFLKNLLADDFKRDDISLGMEFPAGWRILPVHTEISRLLLGKAMGDEGKEFIQWALEELTAWAKASYRKEDNSFVPMLTDGTKLEGYILKRGSSCGPKGTILKAIPADSLAFWVYSMAYRITGDAFMWEMVCNIAQGNNFGDIRETLIDESRPNKGTNSLDCYALLAFLELYRKTENREFLNMASKIGENIISYRFHKGFFVESKGYIYARCDAIEPLALLHLYTTLRPLYSALPPCWLNRSLFEAPYRYKGDLQDSVIYTLTNSVEPPISLVEVVAMGNITLVDSFIAKGADINGTETNFLITPLYRAAMAGYKNIAELLIIKGADLDLKGDWLVNTPLHVAAENGHKEIVELLINHGVDVNVKNHLLETPLQYAMNAGNKETIGLLLQRGGAIASIHIASYMGDLEKAKFFINKGIDINALDGPGYAPLHYAVMNNQKQAVELLIVKGADVNIRNWSGQTPLDLAINRGYKQTTELLLNSGAKATIHIAIWLGDLAKVREFLEEGADVNAKGPWGQTALQIAASEGYKEIVELLLKKGAKVNATGNNKTAAEFAMNKNHSDIVELLISKGADVTVLHLAISMKDENKARNLIEAGADVDKSTQYGTTPLHIAAGAGLKNIVQLLIEKGADVNAKGNWDWSPLHSAVEAGYNEIVELLIAAGADVNTKDGGGHTSLWRAKRDGYTEIVEILRKHGAKEDGEEEKTPESAPAPKEDTTTDPNAIELNDYDTDDRASFCQSRYDPGTAGSVNLRPGDVDHFEIAVAAGDFY